MPPSLKYRLIGGGTAWATSLAEARVHHPGRVDGPWDEQPWNIYLVGHGYTMRGGVRDPQILGPEPGGRLAVPDGLTLFFYCPEGGVFDSGDEQRIVNPADLAAQARGYRYTRPDALPYAEVVDAGNHHGLPEHVLSFPSLRTSFQLGQMVQVWKSGFFPDLDHRTTISPHTAKPESARLLTNGSGVYVGHQKKLMPMRPNHWRNLLLGNWFYLSSLLAWIARHHVPTHVHWLACRERLDDLAAFYASAAGTFGMEIGPLPRPGGRVLLAFDPLRHLGP